MGLKKAYYNGGKTLCVGWSVVSLTYNFLLEYNVFLGNVIGSVLIDLLGGLYDESWLV